MSGGDSGNTFSKLASDLSPEERARMLQSLQARPGTPEPDGDGEGRAPRGFEEYVASLSFWQRIVLAMAQLFRSESKESIVKSWVLRALASDVAAADPTVDTKRGVLTADFARDLDSLHERMAPIAAVTQRSAAGREELALHAAAHALPKVHQQLVDAVMNAEPSRFSGEAGLRKALVARLDEVLDGTSAEQRALVRRVVAQVDHLARAVRVPLRSLAVSFIGSGSDRTCSFADAKGRIVTIAGELSGIPWPIERATYEVIAAAGDDPDAENRDAAREARVEALRSAFETLHAFVRSHPLPRIARLCSADPWLTVKAPAAVDDWSRAYRVVFMTQIDRVVATAALVARTRELADVTVDVSGGFLSPLPGREPEAMPPRGWLPALAVSSFSDGFFHDALPILRMVHQQGEFVKAANRAQFNDAYTEFEQIPGRIARARDQLARSASAGEPPEERGVAMEQALTSVNHISLLVVEQLDRLILGILQPERGSLYESLANLAQIGGRRNAAWLDELRLVQTRLHRLAALIQDLSVLEQRLTERGVVPPPIAQVPRPDA